jgi:hypothetical protein
MCIGSIVCRTLCVVTATFATSAPFLYFPPASSRDLSSKQRACVCAWHSLKGERLIGVPSNFAEHNKYLILFVECITLSPRAYMQFHNQERQLISLCEIQKCHAVRETDRNSSAGCSRFPLLYLMYSLFQRTCLYFTVPALQRTCLYFVVPALHRTCLYSAVPALQRTCLYFAVPALQRTCLYFAVPALQRTCLY